MISHDRAPSGRDGRRRWRRYGGVEIRGPFMKPVVASLAIRRQGDPSDLVDTCLFLLSDAPARMTGHVVDMDGGQVLRA